jgi:ribosomal protein S27E
MEKTQRPRRVLVSDDEDETTAKRRFLAESGVVEAERKTSGVSVLCLTVSISWFASESSIYLYYEKCLTCSTILESSMSSLWLSEYSRSVACQDPQVRFGRAEKDQRCHSCAQGTF